MEAKTPSDTMLMTNPYNQGPSDNLGAEGHVVETKEFRVALDVVLQRIKLFEALLSANPNERRQAQALLGIADAEPTPIATPVESKKLFGDAPTIADKLEAATQRYLEAGASPSAAAELANKSLAGDQLLNKQSAARVEELRRRAGALDFSLALLRRQAMDEQLKPCPFCGSHRVTCHGEDPDISTWKLVRVACDECGITTRNFGTRAEAIAFWNVRPERKD